MYARTAVTYYGLSAWGSKEAERYAAELRTGAAGKPDSYAAYLAERFGAAAVRAQHDMNEKELTAWAVKREAASIREAYRLALKVAKRRPSLSASVSVLADWGHELYARDRATRKILARRALARKEAAQLGMALDSCMVVEVAG